MPCFVLTVLALKVPSKLLNLSTKVAMTCLRESSWTRSLLPTKPNFLEHHFHLYLCIDSEALNFKRANAEIGKKKIWFIPS